LERFPNAKEIVPEMNPNKVGRGVSKGNTENEVIAHIEQIV
jgi:hypothetical protein